MVICLDRGNTRLKGALFLEGRILHKFVISAEEEATPEALSGVLKREWESGRVPAKGLSRGGYSSVAPSRNHLIEKAFLLAFNKEIFRIGSSAGTGWKTRYRNPEQLGSDRMALAAGGARKYPKKNLLLVDMGTATNIEAVNSQGEHLGGVILPGVLMGRDALTAKAEKLKHTEIALPAQVCGLSTEECIQSGLFLGNLGAVRELLTKMKQEAFPLEPALIIGTGGLAGIFQKEELFDAIEPDLVLEGIYYLQEINQ